MLRTEDTLSSLQKDTQLPALTLIKVCRVVLRFPRACKLAVCYSFFVKFRGELWKEEIALSS